MGSYKVVLVTGASAGFGKAICKLLAKEGYMVIATARRIAKLQDLASECGANVYPLELDVCSEISVASLFERLPEPLRKIDVLINNAGLALGQDKAQNCDFNDWQTMVDTNITGLLRLTHKVLPQMVKRNLGYIINLGSIAGNWPYVGGNVYGGTKAFVEQFSRNLRTDLAETAIKVTVVRPGLCSNTEFSNVRFKGDDSKVEAVYKDTKAILPQDIADTVLWLLNAPIHLNINDIEMMPVCQSFGGLSIKRNLDLNPRCE